jgi:hypothetical protein
MKQENAPVSSLASVKSLGRVENNGLSWMFTSQTCSGCGIIYPKTLEAGGVSQKLFSPTPLLKRRNVGIG